MKAITIILRWIDKYTFTVAAILIGIFFLYHEIKRPSLTTEDDVLQIEGIVKDYSFQRKAGYRATLKQYYIWLEDYPSKFQIKADFLPFFYQTKFESEIRNGDVLKITVPKEHEEKIWKSGESVFILSASSQTATYLDENETINKENDNFDIYVGIAFITAGIIYFMVKKLGLIK